MSPETFQTQLLDRGWKFKDKQDPNPEAWYPVTRVPSVIHLDLLDNNLIPDPFVGLNETKVEWVGDRDWVYRTTFPTPEKRTPGMRYSLLFEGLDTFAAVALNGDTDESGLNVLEIVFESPVRRGREIVKCHPEHRYIAHQTEVGRLGARKAAYHWGWDWGPILVTTGPWRPIRLETYVGRIDELWMQSAVSEDLQSCSGSWRREWGQNRRCGGVLVWQLNDCWPVISWAVVDYFLIKKPAFYAIARASLPLAIGVSRNYHEWVSGHARPPKTSRFDVWAVSNKLETVTAVVEVRYISIATGKDIKPSSQHNIEITPNGTTDILTDTLDYTRQPNDQPMVISAKLLVNGAIVSRDVDWPQPLKYLNLTDRGVKVEYLADQSAISVTVAKPTKGLVFEERPGLWFSDNGIDVVPGDEQVIAVKGIDSQENMPGWTYLEDDRMTQ